MYKHTYKYKYSVRWPPYALNHFLSTVQGSFSYAVYWRKCLESDKPYTWKTEARKGSYLHNMILIISQSTHAEQTL